MMVCSLLRYLVVFSTVVTSVILTDHVKCDQHDTESVSYTVTPSYLACKQCSNNIGHYEHIVHVPVRSHSLQAKTMVCTRITYIVVVLSNSNMLIEFHRRCTALNFRCIVFATQAGMSNNGVNRR